jgi:hypothetical protein
MSPIAFFRYLLVANALMVLLSIVDQSPLFVLVLQATSAGVVDWQLGRMTRADANRKG